MKCSKLEDGLYQSKSILLASKHQKESVIAPVFHQILRCKICVEAIDTDQFGTFTGEIPRQGSARETCILKAKYAAFEKKHALSMASEGSFGPHPINPFIAKAQEIMIFFDSEHDWIIGEELLTPKTNYLMKTIDKDTPLEAFLSSALFPSHALTLQSGDRKEIIAKGINDPLQLQGLLSKGFKNHKELFLATDMRAMMNPTRMQTLSELAEKLALRIKTPCPGCGIPGFGFKSVSGHLPCGLCGAETKRYKNENWGCIQCDYQEQRPRQDQLSSNDPTHCDFCNP